ncbi:RNA-binding protein, putative [Bodo saltans]|uniref:RNA-binding protein, putative n=1 Tax=Bodo saltans TaxID=75058 RepID=A0A0S4JU26_BODSA|nr:RNA-binding protein, putative [Bodo saltans]|eukprot:CUG94081.1 RNA-binding protein, putative [Bodo saltans]
MASRSNSPASTISIDDSAGHDNSVLTIHTASNNCQMNESVQHEALLTALNDEHAHWLHVQKLDKSTSNLSLREIFYHFGANEAFVIPDFLSHRPHGFVCFSHSSMADLAVEKVHTFVPFRQTGPLIVQHVVAEAIREMIVKQTFPEVATEGCDDMRKAICAQLWEVLHPSQTHNLQVFLSTHHDLSNEALAEMMITSIEATSPLQRLNLATLLCKNSTLSRLPRGDSIRAVFLNELLKYRGILLTEIQRLFVGEASSEPIANRVRPTASAQTQRRVHDATLRTVYLSKIPSELSRTSITREVSRHGQVLKLRTCSGNTGGTSYAFVEMDTAAAANMLVGCGQLVIEGYTLRTQHAKAPIQDAARSDTVARSTSLTR